MAARSFITVSHWASLVVVCWVTLCGCGSADGALFTASGVSEGGAGSSAGSAGAVTSHAGSAGSAPSGGAGGASEGGSPAAGAASAGAAGSGPSACAGKTTPPLPLIADFEHGVTGWASYMGEGGNTVFGSVQNTQPGAAQTTFAATFSGGAAQTSGMFHTQYCSDVSAFDGISFYAKGKGGDHVRFLAVIPATDPTAVYGDCDSATSVCSDHPGMPFVLSDQWQAYHVAWKDLAQYGWGTKASFAGVLNAVLWINDGPVAGFELSIDQVKLYAGTPPA